MALFVVSGPAVQAAGDFVNFETPPVHPLDLSPDGNRLALANVASGRVDVYRILGDGSLLDEASISTGVDPVSVRWRNDTEIWVVNHVSDSVSVVDLVGRRVVATLATDDEPCDVVFAGSPERAFVSCSAVDRILVFDPSNLSLPPQRIPIEGEDPRALAVSPDGNHVYAAIFESGNGTTLLAGGGDGDIIDFPPNAVSDPRGPYGGQNPPPNQGDAFEPPLNTQAGTPPPVGLIVRQNSQGQWLDDNGGDWSAFVSGNLADASGRPVGWTLIDNDVAVIDASSMDVSYRTGLMNLCMSIGVNPATGEVTVVGTEATNEKRFEPNVNGTFVRAHLSRFDPQSTGGVATHDLNPHLDYTVPRLAQAERDRSLGNPRAIVWRANGVTGYVAGMGSNNLIQVDENGERTALPPIEVGAGPSGLSLDESRDRLYVYNRFDASISIVGLDAHQEIDRIGLFDPTPEAIRSGRAFLYDTHRTSGLGQVSCASCHADARTDRLAWDLGDPSGSVKEVGEPLHNLGAGIPGLNGNFTDFHPLKGPMLTQTMQDIIGKEPHHWRGDRDGLEEFNGAFVGLLGDDTGLTTNEMQQFEDFLASIYFPPNPFRNLDNSFPTDLPLPGHYTSGRFGPAGQPLPNGNARRGLDTLYRPLSRAIDRGAFACVTCHTVPTGMGSDTKANLFAQSFDPIPPGPNGERHHFLVSVDGSSQRAFKVPQLRSLYDRVGFEMTQPVSRSGFGYGHDGAVDSLARFFSEGAFTTTSDQEIADLVALMLSFSGSDFGAPIDALEPPGTASQDVPAAVGRQTSLTGTGTPADAAALLNELLVLASVGQIDLVAHAAPAGEPRGWTFENGAWSGDENQITNTLEEVLEQATDSAPVTFTAVAAGTGRRLGVERDRDGLLDHDEFRDFVPSVPGRQNPFRPDAYDSTGDNGLLQSDGVPDGQNDFDGDGISNADEIAAGTNPADMLAVNPPMNLSIQINASVGSATIEWTAGPLAQYEIHWSSDLINWQLLDRLPVEAPLSGGELNWTDEGPPDTPKPPAEDLKRFYRVERIR